MSETVATTGHNSLKARAATVRDLMAKLDEIDARKAEIAAEAKTIKGRIKAELGWKVSDFNVVRRFYQLENEHREELFDVIREGFKALSIGEQSSFLGPLEGGMPAADIKAARKAQPSLEDAKAEGAAAYSRGEAQDAFPEAVRTKKQRAAWLEGWDEAKAEHMQAGEAKDAADFDDTGMSGVTDESAAEEGEADLDEDAA